MTTEKRFTLGELAKRTGVTILRSSTKTTLGSCLLRGESVMNVAITEKTMSMCFSRLSFLYATRARCPSVRL